VIAFGRLRLLLTLLLAAGLAEAAAAAEFDRAVLARLSREQVMAYLRAADAALTIEERGAKYLWGSVPLDRESPAYLGQWWSRLSAAEREAKMLAWFNRHLGAIDLDDVRAKLNITDVVNAVRVERGPDPNRETVPWWLQRPATAPDTPVRVIPPVPAAAPPRTDRPVAAVAPAAAGRRTAGTTTTGQGTTAGAAAPAASANNAAARPDGTVAGAPARTAAGTATGNRPPAPPLRGVTVAGPVTTAPDTTVGSGTAGGPAITGGETPSRAPRGGISTSLRNSE